MHVPTTRRTWLAHLSAVGVAGLGVGRVPIWRAGATPLDVVLSTRWGTGEPVEDGVVRLDRNESPYGPSPRAVAAMAAVLAQGNRYAHEARDDLTAKLAKLAGLPEESVLVGDGSTEPMGLMAGTLFRDGGEILSADRTFGVLQRNVERLGGRWSKVPLDGAMRVDLTALARAITPATRAIYLCNPNNPTGTTIAPDLFRAACLEMSKRTLVVVDEAYADYLPPAQRPDLASLVRAGENVCLLRTFSKIHGMAGLRVGCAMGRKELLTRLRRNEWGTQMTNLPGLVGAAVSLDDTENIAQNRQRNAAVMAKAQAMLTALGYAPVPSVANHIWFATRRPAAKFKADLAKAGYAVVASTEKDGDWCRLTLGTAEQMAGFEKALRAIA